jgi:hypothetical protein
MKDFISSFPFLHWLLDHVAEGLLKGFLFRQLNHRNNLNSTVLWFYRAVQSQWHLGHGWPLCIHGFRKRYLSTYSVEYYGFVSTKL